MKNPEGVIYIAGVARSGTSWVGQVFNSSPQVAFCFQPFFSYEFKGRVNEDSSGVDYQRLFAEMFAADTLFLKQKDKQMSGEYPQFQKNTAPSVLIIKENRYQSLLEPMLRRVPIMKGIGITRHPCAVLNSWRKNEKEFPAGADFLAEWRFGACKNKGNEDYFGFYKWKEVAHLYLDLADKWPDRFRAVRYEDIVSDPEAKYEELFEFCGIPFVAQTRAFLRESTQRHTESYYGVYKNKSVADRWRAELDTYVIEQVLADLKGTRLERYVAIE